MLLFVTAVATALVISFLCSIMEAVVLSISNAEIESLLSDGKRSGALMQDFKRNIDIPIAAILILNTVAHTVGATVAGASYQDAFSTQSLWLFSLIFTVAILLFTEIIPKTFGATHAKELAGPVAWGVRILSTALAPLVWISERISRSLRGARETPVTSTEEIRLLALLGHKEGVVGENIASIIAKTTRLSHLTAFDVMVPKPQIVFLSATRSEEDNLQVIRDSGHSRVPFSTSEELDDVVGVALVKELFFYCQEHPDKPIEWNDILRKPLIVPESQRLSGLLTTFQEARSHLALVVDEYGSVIGIVTLEDVIEEIVGDIIDESDLESDDFTSQADGSLEILAAVDIRKVCDHFGLEWPSNVEFKSIGGLVTELLERVPETGDVVEWKGYRLEVCAASPKRAQRIRMRPLEIDKESPELNDPDS